MAIRQLLPDAPSRTVAWFQEIPPTEAVQVLDERRFAAVTVTAGQLQHPGDLSGLAAVIFTQRATKLSEIRRQLAAHAPLLLDCYCRVIVRPAEVPRVLGAVKPIAVVEKVIADLHLPAAGIPGIDDALPPHVMLFDVGVSWSAIVTYIADNLPGRAPAQAAALLIDARNRKGRRVQVGAQHGNTCSPGRLRIAQTSNFGLCADEERSGIPVAHAHAELRDPPEPLSRYPVPYFVKVGARTEILNEYRNYERRVAPYIPFHLGPHPRARTLLLGSTRRDNGG